MSDKFRSVKTSVRGRSPLIWRDTDGQSCDIRSIYQENDNAAERRYQAEQRAAQRKRANAERRLIVASVQGEIRRHNAAKYEGRNVVTVALPR